MPRKQIQQSKIKTFFIKIFLILVFILLLPFIILFLAYYFLKGKWLGFQVKQHWYPKGKFLLFVYSDSPTWKDYIEKNILPEINAQAIVINWSERSRWKWQRTLELQVFQHWSSVTQFFIDGRKEWDGKEFCPIAIIFRPWWKPKVIKFWQAFKDFKHGKDASLKKYQKELFESLKK